MAVGCLENIWQDDLRAAGWSNVASSRYMFCLAKSTRVSYNNMLNKCQLFCSENNAAFPPHNSATLADFLCYLADSSNRPRSLLCTASAALSIAYVHSGLPDLTKYPCIVRLCTALVKSGTKETIHRSSVLPVEAFHRMFNAWDVNDRLSIPDLRLKAITLLALGIMLRPSDIAPRGEVFDSLTGETSKFTFTTDMLAFTPEGVKITLMAIKNDYCRSGFEVFLPTLPNPKMDPVHTLHSYIQRTEPVRSDGAVFLSLKRPYKAISASSVAKILDSSISRAGLSGQGFSAKSFRPTGATRAIDAGIDPDIVQKVGRWKCTEVFRNHYVHSKTPKEFTSAVIG